MSPGSNECAGKSCEKCVGPELQVAVGVILLHSVAAGFYILVEGSEQVLAQVTTP